MSENKNEFEALEQTLRKALANERMQGLRPEQLQSLHEKVSSAKSKESQSLFWKWIIFAVPGIAVAVLAVSFFRPWSPLDHQQEKSADQPSSGQNVVVESSASKKAESPKEDSSEGFAGSDEERDGAGDHDGVAKPSEDKPASAIAAGPTDNRKEASKKSRTQFAEVQPSAPSKKPAARAKTKANDLLALGSRRSAAGAPPPPETFRDSASDSAKAVAPRAVKENKSDSLGRNSSGGRATGFADKGVSADLKDSNSEAKSRPVFQPISVVPGSIKVVGTLPVASIHDVLLKHKSSFNQCYYSSRQRTKKTEGTLQISWSIDAKGIPTNIALKSWTLGDKEISDCVLKNISKFKFPKNSRTQVEITLRVFPS